MQKVRWGMVGCGAVTEVKSGPGLYKSENSELIGVYDINIETAKAWVARHGVGKVYESVDEMLADDDIDIVYLPTPPKFHKDYAIKVLEAGKIPYVEKPMANTFEDCMAIIEKANEVGLPVYVAFYRRAMEKYIKIKEIAQSGVLGDIRYMQVKQIMTPEDSDYQKDNLPWRVRPETCLAGKFMDMQVHVIDVLTFLFGKITEVNGVANNMAGLYEVEDTVSAAFKFESGIVGSGMWCYVADHNVDEILIVGSKGRLSGQILWYGDLTVTVGEKVETYSFIEPKHVAMPYEQSIVNELIGKEKSNANVEEAANVTKFFDEVLKEYRKRYKL